MKLCPISLMAPVPGALGGPAEHQCSTGGPGHPQRHSCGCGMTWTAAQSEASKRGAVVTLTDLGGAAGIRVDVEAA